MPVRLGFALVEFEQLELPDLVDIKFGKVRILIFNLSCTSPCEPCNPVKQLPWLELNDRDLFPLR